MRFFILIKIIICLRIRRKVSRRFTQSGRMLMVNWPMVIQLRDTYSLSLKHVSSCTQCKQQQAMNILLYLLKMGICSQVATMKLLRVPHLHLSLCQLDKVFILVVQCLVVRHKVTMLWRQMLQEIKESVSRQLKLDN